MASEIVHDVLDLELETLEAFIPETDWNCYPYPALRKTGRKATISIRTVTLSNAYLQATIALDLGGRLIQLFDRRTQREILPLVSNLTLREGGSRGVFGTFGIEIVSGVNPRANALGPVEHTIHEPESEEEPAKVVLWENMIDHSFQATWALFPDEAALELEVRDYSRPNGSVKAGFGLGLGLFFPGSLYPGEGGCSIVGADGVGIGCYFESQTFNGLAGNSDGLIFSRGGTVESLITHVPGTLDRWRVKVLPISLPSVCIGFSSSVNIGLAEKELHLQSSRLISGAKVFVNTVDGPVEASIDLDPVKLQRLDLSSLGSASKILIRDSEKRTLAECDFRVPAMSFSQFDRLDEKLNPEAEAIAKIRRPGDRSWGYFNLAQISNRSGNPKKALDHLEESLNSNAEDAIAWWFKAALERNDPAFNPEEERTALLNAHFISPMEPMLRAEAVLSTPEGNPEPSPLMKPLLQNPESLTDAVCLLIECGFKADATRLIHEALKHENILILRVLLASILLKDTKFEFDVADQLREAAKVQPRPPYPWRTTEFNAIRDLLARFPNDPVLNDLRQIIFRGTGNLIGE